MLKALRVTFSRRKVPLSLHLNQQNQRRFGPLGGQSQQGSGVLSDGYELVKTLMFFVVMAIILKASVVEAFKIPSSSMVPTLEIGDHILVNKLSYGFRLPLMTETVFDYRIPERGDVVVFTLPEDSGTNIIKRVIGVPGDTIQVKGMKLYINGQVFDKDSDYAIWVRGGVKDFGPVVVPPGKIFMLGDNREDSFDSRYWGPVPIELIRGRAIRVWFNFKLGRIGIPLR